MNTDSELYSHSLEWTNYYDVKYNKTQNVCTNMLKKTLQGIIQNIEKSLGYEHNAQIYGNALAVSLRKNRIIYDSKVIIPIIYEEKTIGYDTVEMVIENNIIIEFSNHKSENREKLMKKNIKITNCNCGLIVYVNNNNFELKWIYPNDSNNN